MNLLPRKYPVCGTIARAWHAQLNVQINLARIQPGTGGGPSPPAIGQCHQARWRPRISAPLPCAARPGRGHVGGGTVLVEDRVVGGNRVAKGPGSATSLGPGCGGALLLRVPPRARGRGGSVDRSRRGRCGGRHRPAVREGERGGGRLPSGTSPLAAPVAHRSGAGFRSVGPVSQQPPRCALLFRPGGGGGCRSAQSGSIRAPGAAAGASPGRARARADPAGLGGGEAEPGAVAGRGGSGSGSVPVPRPVVAGGPREGFGWGSRAWLASPPRLRGVSFSRRCNHGQVQEPHHAQPV